MWTKIKKFGLQHSDFPTMLWNVTSMLKVLALDIDPRSKTSIGVLSYVWLIFICLSYYYVYLVSMAWFVFWRSQQSGAFVPAIIVFSLGVSSEISMTKMISLFVYRKRVKQIIAAYLSCDALVEPNTRFAANLAAVLRKVKKRAIIVWMVVMWNGIIYAIKPLCLSGRHHMDDEFIFLGLEPMEVSPNYEIAYFFNLIGLFVTCFPAGNVTALFIIMAGYTEAQMLALSDELTHLWEDALENNPGIIEGRRNTKGDVIKLNKFIRSRLVHIVNIHTININLLHQIESVFKGALAMEFILLIIALIADLLSGLEKTYIELPFALMFVGSDCLTGQRIRDAGLVFEKAVYDSKWENFDVANRKIVLLMLQNSQKVMKLSAGGVATLSLECLMSVLRTTYSAYTALRSTMK